MTDQHRPLALKVFSLSALVLLGALSAAMDPRLAAAEPAVTPKDGLIKLFESRSATAAGAWSYCAASFGAGTCRGLAK